jgi:hypothetical protein
VASGLDAVADVTLVDPRDAFVHNIATLRALVAPDWIEQIFFPYDRLLQRGLFVRDRAVHAEPGVVTLSRAKSCAPTSSCSPRERDTRSRQRLTTTTGRRRPTATARCTRL